MNRSARQVLTLLCWILPWLLSVAVAAEAKKEKEDPSPWSYGGRLQLEVCYDETVLPRSGRSRDPNGTLCTTIGPRLFLRYSRKPDRVDLFYDVNLRQYQELEERNSMMQRLSGRWTRPLTDKLSMRLDERITYREDTGGESDETITRPSTYVDNMAALTLNARLHERWRGTLRLEHEIRAYDDRSFDSWYTIGPSVELAYIQNRDCRWTLKHEFNYLSVDDEDNERTHRVLAGYACVLPFDLRFDVRAGVMAWGDRANTDPAGAVRLTKRWDKASVALRWERRASVSSSSGRVVRRDYLIFQPSYRITPKTQALGRVSLLMQESLDDDRTDTSTWRSSITIRQTISKALRADLAYTYVDQDVRGTSGTPLSGSIVSLGLTASF